MCTVLLPPGVNLIAVNKCININTNMAHVYYMLDTYGYSHTLRICNTYCFTTVTIVARTRLNIVIRRLPELLNVLTNFKWRYNNAVDDTIVNEFSLNKDEVRQRE
jgi:hypothetical protein